MTVTWKQIAYEDDIAYSGVYVDSVNGVSGTDWPIGTPSCPVDNLTDAITIAAARKTTTFQIRDSSGNLVIPATMNGYVFVGRSCVGFLTGLDQIDLNEQNSNNCTFINLVVKGDANGSEISGQNCQLLCTNYGTASLFKDCLFMALLLLVTQKFYLLIVLHTEHLLLQVHLHFLSWV